MTGGLRFYRLSAAFLILLAALPASALPLAPPGLLQPSIGNSPADVQYRKGLEAINKNDLNTAETAFREILKTDAKFAPALLGLAHVSVKRNQPKEAEGWLQKALVVAPDNAEVLTSWGRYLRSQKQFAKAETIYRKAIAVSPKAFPPRIDLADLYLDSLHKPAEAIEAYRAALSIEPNHGGAHYGLGMALIQSGKSMEAITEFEKARQLAPDNPLPLQVLGQLYKEQKQYDKALQSFDKAVTVQSGFIPAYVGRGDVYALQGNDAKAITEYQAALKISPKSGIAHMQLGSAYLRQKRYAEAEIAYLVVVESESRNALAYNNLAWMAAERKARLNDALRWAQKAVELEPAVAQFQDTLGWVHRSRGELEKAALVMKKAAAISPPQADIHYHLGIIYSEKGKQKEAVAALKKAIDLRKPFPEAEEALRQAQTQGKR